MNTTTNNSVLSKPDRCVCTQAVGHAIHPMHLKHALQRHLSGDWGHDLCEEDRKANDAAVESNGQVLSKYGLPEEDSGKMVEIYVISDAGHLIPGQHTVTFLFPDEY